MKKMSKSNSTEATIKEITSDIVIAALRNELEYWKTRHALVTEYKNGVSP